MMENYTKNKQEKQKIEFSEVADAAISGYALAFTFIAVSIFLLNNLDYFGNKIVSIVILSVFSLVGVVGTLIELGKNKFIKGIDDLAVGVFFFVPWLLLYIFVDKLWVNIITFMLLIIGTYSIVSGMIKMGYSVLNSTKTSTKKIRTGIVNSLKVLPAIASFILVVFNIIKIIDELEWMVK